MALISNSLYPSSLTTTSTTTVASSSKPVSRGEESLGMDRLLSNLLDAMATPSSLTGAVPHPANPQPEWRSTFSQAVGTPPQNPIGPAGRGEYLLSSVLHSYGKADDTPSGSPGTSSSISIACFRCDERAPANRCLECNELYCHECSTSLTSDCQLREHTLLPMSQLSPPGGGGGGHHHARHATSDKDVQCELHGEAIRFYCESCASLICQECTLWKHKEHVYAPMRGALDSCRLKMLKALESGKTGTKAIKGSIDKAVAISKTIERDAADVTLKIRRVMRHFMQAIEDREKYLLEKVERMRQLKLNELSDQMNSLRGILAGLAHTNETLVKCLDLEGIDLFMAKEKGMAQIEYFAGMYKNLQPKDDNLVFIPPNYDLVDQLKRQCDVIPASFSAVQSLQSTSMSAPIPLPTMSVLPDVSRPPMSRGMHYYDGARSTSSLSLEVNSQRGIGQAIPGYWLAITAKPNRNPVPGVPVLSFAREGHEDGQVSRPWGLCVDRDGNIIVADRRNNRIQIFNSKGEFKSKFGSKGTGPGEFDLPAGITTDSYGRIIVIDKDNHRVQIFTSTGIFILKFGSFGKDCGQFQYPWDVAVNTLGNIAVTDTRNHRVQLFTADGTFITKFLLEGANPAKLLKGPTTPRGVCFSTIGNLIVSDFENHRLIMIDSSLSRVLCVTGREGAGLHDFNRPSGIIVDDEGRVIVADSKNHRVLVFSPELHYLWAVDLKSPGLDDKDRPSDVALTLEGYLVVLFETLPDTRDGPTLAKQYIKVY